MGRFREKLGRFFAGRNGPDRLSNTAVWIGLLLSLVNLFLGWISLSVITFLLMGYALFRILSRKVWKRREEDRRFRQAFARPVNFCKLQRNRFRDRKTHVFRRCPGCRSHLRLPKKQGIHTVCCPCCKRRFEVKIR